MDELAAAIAGGRAQGRQS
jgi:hypothetical protein